MSDGLGKAHIFSSAELTRVFKAIQQQRHPEKNLCIVLFSFCLGLRAQEIALIENQFVLDICDSHPAGFKVKELMKLPKRVTKGARATETTIPESEQQPEELREGRLSVRYSLSDFDDLVKRIAKDARGYAGTLEPTEYYPPRKLKKGNTRELALTDELLIRAIHNYALTKQATSQRLYKSHPFIVSQKDQAYSPNTMQQHMAKIYRKWAGVKEARSHSGRRTLATHLLKHQNESVEVVMQILGHKSAATTIGYKEDPSPEEIRDALSKARININETELV